MPIYKYNLYSKKYKNMFIFIMSKIDYLTKHFLFLSYFYFILLSECFIVIIKTKCLVEKVFLVLTMRNINNNYHYKYENY